MKNYKKILAVLLCSTMMTGMIGDVAGAEPATEEFATEKLAIEETSTEVQSSEESGTEEISTETQPTEEQPTEEQPTEEPSTESMPTQTQPSETSDATANNGDVEIALPQAEDIDSTGYIDVEIYYWESRSTELQAGETFQIPIPDINVWHDDDNEVHPPTKEQVRAGLTYTSSDPSVLTVDPKTGFAQAIAAKAENNGCTEVKVTVSYTDNYGNVSSAVYDVEVYNTIELNQTSATIYTGQSKKTKLIATTNPKEATVTWTSSQTSIVTVSATGELTPKKTGTATITATAGGVSASCTVTVKKPSISLASKKTLYVGNKEKIAASSNPQAKLTWSSSNKKIATVDAKGTVTPKKTGKVTITAKALGISKKCTITVKKPSVKFNSTELTAFAGSVLQLGATVKPASALKWKSSNKKVATVDKSGKVTTKKVGTATITAYVSGAKATCKVKVIKNPYSLNTSSKTIMAGSTASIYVKGMTSYSYVNYNMEGDWGIASVSSEDGVAKVTGVTKGTVTLTANAGVYVDGTYVYWQDTCKIKVIDEGINVQQFSLAKGKTQLLKVKKSEDSASISTIQWSSSKPSVASVGTTDGLVKAKKTGTAKITAKITYSDGKTATYVSTMKVSDPKLKSSNIVVTNYKSKTISLKGINGYSSSTWKSSKKSVVTVARDGTVNAYKKGTATITITVDGKKLTCKVYVSDPKLKNDYSGMMPGGTSKILLTGTSKKSKITYSSSNTNVAKVSASGQITAITCGNATITINADGRKMQHIVEVAPAAAWSACNKGYSIINSSTYSQTYRMTEGYYDCSSLVFRSYDRNAALLGGGASWAPTAAGMATHMAQTGKVIAYQSLPISQILPGDLIFYGNENNGRYLGIYHVSMYYGNGDRLEKPLRSYYESSNIVMIARPVR